MTDILPPAGWPNVRQLETNEFATGGANGNMNEQAKSLAARSELLKRYAALPYESKTGGYALNERVQLATGDIVRSTIPSNVKNPNVDMTGWVNAAAWSNIKNKPTTVAGYGITDAYTKTEVNTAIANATPTIPNATETTAGKVKIHNTLNSTATDAALTAAQGKVLYDQSFGVGQSWQNVKSSRVAGTTYTNTTSRPIVVNVTANGYQATTRITAKVLGVSFIIGVDSTPYDTLAAGSFVVPSGAGYSVGLIDGGLDTWYEFR